MGGVGWGWGGGGGVGEWGGGGRWEGGGWQLAVVGGWRLAAGGRVGGWMVEWPKRYPNLFCLKTQIVPTLVPTLPVSSKIFMTKTAGIGRVHLRPRF